MYRIKILTDSSFDALPYKGAKEALGLADPKTDTAYIRRVHWGEISKDVQLLTIQHELDELLSKISPDEEDGIRYKKVKNILRPIVTGAAALINPVLGAAVGGGWSGVEAIRGKESPWMVPVHAGLGFLGGKLAAAGRGAGVDFGQAFKAGFAAPSAFGVLGKTIAGLGAGSGLMAAPGLTAGTPYSQALGSSAATSALVGATPGTAGTGFFGTGAGALNKLGLIGTGAGQIGSTINRTGNALSVGGGGLFQAAGPNVSKGLLQSPMSKLGLGAMALSALPINATPPNIGSTVSKWLTQDTVTEAGKKAKEFADVEYGGPFQPSNEIKAFIDIQGKDIERAYDKRAKEMDEMFSRIHPNWQTSGQRIETMRDLQDKKQQEIDRVQTEWLLTAQREHATRQYNYVMQNLQVDDQTKRDLLYGDLSDVMLRYQIKQDDLMNFRKIAANAGMYLTLGGVGAFNRG